MTNTLTAVALLKPLVSSDFSEGSTSTQLETALATSFVYCSAIKASTIVKTGSDWTDFVITEDGEAMAVTLLAQAILNEGRRITRSRNETLEIRTIPQLFTEEMKMLLVNADYADESTVFWSSDNPTNDWVVNS